MAGMTRYSIDSNVRTKAMLCVATLSLVCAAVTNLAFFPCLESLASCMGIGAIYQNLSKIGLIGSAAAFAWYGVFWYFFDSKLWKLFKCFHGIPDLSGDWVGRATSSFKDEGGNPYSCDMKLKITHTFTKIQCKACFAASESESSCVGISACNAERDSCRLEFSYENEAGENAVRVGTWQESHLGFNRIRCEGNMMKGQYFMNREPQTKGTFVLERKTEDVK